MNTRGIMLLPFKLTYVIEDRCTYIILFVQFQCWSFLESYLQLHVRWQFNMIEAFANESETANIERLVTAALSAQRQRRETSSRRTSKTSHFSPTGKTEAGLFRLHQQHTHLNILERSGPFLIISWVTVTWQIRAQAGPTSRKSIAATSVPNSRHAALLVLV